MGIEVKVPALGESITEATLGAWLKKPGDAVAADEPVASLETDKVSVDVPSPVAGVFGEALVAEGETVNVGAVIATIGEGSGATASAPAAKAPEAVTIWHETYAVPAGGHESVYVGPARFGLAALEGVVPVAQRGERARDRMAG